MVNKEEPMQLNNNAVKKHGAIAFLDMLGAKGIANYRNPDKILDTIYDIVNELKNDTFIITVISDTIVVEYEADLNNYRHIITFAKYVSILFTKLFLKDIFMRGAISFGEYYKRENSFLGPAVDDAAVWHELPQMLGIILTPHAELLLKTFSENFKGTKYESTITDLINNSLLLYNVAFKEIRPSFLYCVNWLITMLEHVTIKVDENAKQEDQNISEESKPKKQEIYSQILKQIANHGNISPDIEQKYRETIKFVEKCLNINTNP